MAYDSQGLYVRVRRAEQPDAWALGVLTQESLGEAPSSEFEADELVSDPVRLGADLMTGEGVVVTVAELHGHMVGGVRAVPREFLRSSHVAELSILVHPRGRARGVGVALLERTVELLARMRMATKLCVRVADDDVGLQRLMQRAGWRRERVEEDALRRGGAPHDVWIYARYLDPLIDG